MAAAGEHYRNASGEYLYRMLPPDCECIVLATGTNEAWNGDVVLQYTAPDSFVGCVVGITEAELAVDFEQI